MPPDTGLDSLEHLPFELVLFAVAVQHSERHNTRMAAPVIHTGLETLYTRDQIAKRA